MELLFTAGLGLIIGSFVNVLIARLPSRESIVSPGSRCPACKVPICWYDNVPVLSYVLLRGRCRSCGAGISVRYPIIEVLVALLFVAFHVRFGWSLVLFARDLPFVAILVAITFIDLEHRIIPDPLNLLGLVLGLATSVLAPEMGLYQSIAGAVAGFVVFYGFAWAYHRATGRHGMGGGDIKLLAMLGSFVGPMGVFVTIFASSILGSVIGIAWALARREENVLKSAIPYGPFLVLGALFYYLFGEYLWLQSTIPT